MRWIFVAASILVSCAIAQARCMNDVGQNFRLDQTTTVSRQITCDAQGGGKSFAGSFANVPGAKVTSVSIVGKPSNGGATASKTGFSYKPTAGASGTDSMVLKVCGEQNGQNGCVTVNYTVNIVR
jgi:hypothetical protein